jgi:hypothetical protein
LKNKLNKGIIIRELILLIQTLSQKQFTNEPSQISSSTKETPPVVCTNPRWLVGLKNTLRKSKEALVT